MIKNKQLENALLQTGVSLIPGVGQFLAPLVGALNQPDSPVVKKAAPKNVSNNPYGKIDTLITPDQVPPAEANPFVNNPMAEPNVPLAQPNMFVDNTQPPMQLDPLPAFSNFTIGDGGNSVLTGDPTQVVPEQELTLGKNLLDGPVNTSFTGKTPSLNVDRGFDGNTANAIGLGLKGIALGGSIADALAKPEKEKLITPNYNKADNYIQSANVDYTQAEQDSIGVSNIGAAANRSLASNAAQFQGREQARLAQLQDALGRINMQENNATSQLNLTKGNYEQQKAVDTANRTYQNQQGNMQNQANTRFFDRTLMSDLSQIGSSLNEYGETQKINANNRKLNTFQTNQALAILNSKYPNFKVTSEVMDLLQSGADIDEIVKMK